VSPARCFLMKRRERGKDEDAAPAHDHAPGKGAGHY
jgi:hypothetical protein